MRKLFLFLSLFILLNISTAYIFLFTSFGNQTVASIIENKVQERGIPTFKFDDFVITMSQMNIAASLDESSKFSVAGEIAPLSLKFNLKYDVNLEDLSKLEQFTAQKLQGSFHTNGEINGNKELLLVKGITDVFGSDSKYDVVLKNFSVTNIDIASKGVKIEKALYTLNQPVYATGLVDIDGKITNTKIPTLAGQITTNIHNGALNNKVVNEAFNLKLDTVKLFQGEIITDLKPYMVENKVDFFTSIVNVFVQKARLSLKDNSVISDYQIVFEDLARLYDITQMKLLGNLEINGTVKKDDNLEVTGLAQTLDGEVNYTLYNDELTATLKDIEVLALTKMLTYPSFFDSKANANVNYNLVTQKGDITAMLANGQFVKNRFSSLVNTLAKFDITKEVYENFTLNSQIDKKVINSTADMKSQYTQITVPKSRVDLESKTLDTNVKLDLKGHKVEAKIKGNVDKPDISIDVGEVLKQKAEEKVKKELSKKLNDKLSDEDMDGLIKGLKSLF